MTLKKHQKKSIGIALAAILFFLSFIYKIESRPLRHCDEALVAVQAQEMLITGNYIVGTRHFEVDHWGSKPQLTQWLDVIFMKIFGVREFSVRLPSILAAFGIFLVFFFWNRYLSLSPYFFLLTCFIFVTIPANTFHIHSFRSGDPDALMVFFLVLASFQIYKILFPKEERDNNPDFLYFFLAIFLAFMSKGSHVLIFLPGLGILILLFKPNLIPKFILGGLILLLFVFSYYLIRNSHQPGYLLDVWNNELGGRYLESLEGNKHSFFYYIKNNFVYRNPIWSIVVIASCFGLIFRKIQDATIIFFLVLITSFLFFLSISQTKLEWYDLTIYPFISVFITYTFSLFFKSTPNNAILYALLIPLICVPCYHFSKRIAHFNDEGIDFYKYFYKVCYFLREPLPIAINNNVKLINNGRDGMFEHVLFYTHQNCLSSNCIQWADTSEVSEGDTILIHQHEINHVIREKFEVEELLQDENVQLLKIEALKSRVD